MKKVIALILSFALSVCLVACGNNYECAIDGYTWTMTTIQSLKTNGDVVAYAPHDATFDKDTYPTAVPVDMTCMGKDGSFHIIDKTNGTTYSGNYEVAEKDLTATIYKIVIGENIGRAVVSSTNYQDGTKIPTLIVSIGDYSLNFQSKQ